MLAGFVPSQAGPVEADVLKFYLNTSTNSITGRDSFLSEAQGYRCGFADGLCADTVLYCTVLYYTVLYCRSVCGHRVRRLGRPRAGGHRPQAGGGRLQRGLHQEEVGGENTVLFC